MYISEKPGYEKETAMLIEEILKQRILGMKNEKGVYITPAFPKLLYVTDENNIYPGSEYYYLTELAAECVSKRMLPDFISAKIMRQNYDGEVFGCMGCRSFLAPYKDPNTGKYKWYGRFNQGRQLCPLSAWAGGENPLTCWNEPKALITKTELETINGTVAKAEKILEMPHAEIKAIYYLQGLQYIVLKGL